MSEKIHLALEAAGYTADTLKEASEEDLKKVPGIGKSRARVIRKRFEAWADG
jgi:DNA integrity scanning protein DisA with diadenylate cyclase activity